MSDTFLPYGRHQIDEADIAAVVEVLRGDWLTTGPTVTAFEEAFAAQVGARFAVSCTSGTAALHLAVLALGLGPNDWIAVPTVTFLATANAGRFAGADVLFTDVDPDTGLMTDATLDAALRQAARRNVRAVIPVHLAGQCVPLRQIAPIADHYGLKVIEDASHALGTTYTGDNGKQVRVGSCAHSHLTIFSLHPVKTLTMGEGGVVTTNDPVLYDRLKSFRNHAMLHQPEQHYLHELAFDPEGQPNPWYYEMHDLGFNYRATDIHCALGLSQLAKLDGFITARRKLYDCYLALLPDLAPLVQPLTRISGCDPAWHLMVVLIDFAKAGISRATVMQRLKEQKIGTQVHYLPVNEQPYYRRLYGVHHLPGAQYYYDRTLSLPLFPGMTQDDVKRVVGALAHAFEPEPAAADRHLEQVQS